MSNLSWHPAMPAFQFRLLDLICLLSIQAIAIGGVSHYIRNLPTEIAMVRPSLRAFDYPDRFPPLVSGIIIIATTVLTAFLVAWWVFRRAPPLIQRAGPRVATAFACLIFLTLLWSILGFDYTEHQLLAGDWNYVLRGEWMYLDAALQSRRVQLAAAALCILVGLEIVPLLRVNVARRPE